jgi:translation initiation factor IF-2
VQNGTLYKGDSVVVGNYYGKIKTIVSDKGKRIKEAGPSTPVVISGLDGLPEPGDILTVYEDDREAKDVAEQKQQKARQIELRAKSSRMTLDDLVAQMQDDRESHTLNMIVKGDVQGSVEAIKGSLAHLNEKDTRIKFEVIHSGVGAVNETDVMLAAASDALIVGFNVNADGSAKSSAEEEAVEMRFYSVIYNLLEDLEAIGKGMLDPVFEEINIGTAKVRATFKVPRVGTIAGCYVTEGTIKRNAIVKLYRDGSLIYEGTISSLKRFQDDVREVASGYECGIGLENFNDIKEEDVIEAYIMKETPGV